MATLERASEAQISYIRSLCRERDTDRLTGIQRDWLDSFDFALLTKGNASKVIQALKDLPRAQRQVIDRSVVPTGRYAVIDPADEVLKFYKVDNVTEGRWAGRTFLSVQASDELYPVKNPQARAAVLSRIAEDPKEAMLLYGKELGHCGHCGRTLTNEVSRERGIGPICWGKMGW